MTVSSVVWDLDTHDELLTHNLCVLVQELVDGIRTDDADGYPMLMKEFSGNKGTHIWLFLSEPIDAGKVRRWIGRDFLPRWVELTGGATLEIFPKQDSV